MGFCVSALPHIVGVGKQHEGGGVWRRRRRLGSCFFFFSSSSNCIVKGFAITVSQDLSLCLYAHTHTHIYRVRYTRRQRLWPTS